MRKIDPGKQEIRRRKILDAALACFARKGFSGTTTSEICSEAGMSPGHVFYYFPNKAAIIAAVVDDELREMSMLFSRVAGQEDAIAAIETIASELLDRSLDPVFVRINVEISAEIMRNSEIGQLFAENEQHIKAELIELLEQGIRRGQIDPTISPASAATWLIALFDGLMNRALMDHSFLPEKHAPELMRMLRRYLEPS
ncbi:MAG: TetR/AcrR family transcriptional regulator [Lautropia sp.]|nr:TetR/AcrR family transcriptional regulator [Lautropia sp.]